MSESRSFRDGFWNLGDDGPGSPAGVEMNRDNGR
jgi:hypothetical protein